MKVLWIVNSVLPAPSKALGISSPVVGGWLLAMATQLIRSKKIKLAIATVYRGKEIKSLDIEDVLYYLLPEKSTTTYQTSLEPCWQTICSEFRPDIIHIHGTEYFHGLACMRSCPTMNYVVSIQGILGVISRYYYGGISSWDIFKHITFRDVVRRDSLFQAKKKLESRSILEKEYFQRAQHIIGRTSWDYAHSITLNPSITYHFCNESLRESFYNAPKWDIDSKTDYSIFLSQSVYPIKGLHQVLKAVALIKADFPEIKIRVAGHNILNNNGFTQRIRLSGYGSYIRSIVKKYKLNENLVFTGILSEEQIVTEYKNAHIFICPSSIENSSNSLGEAQLLGVPCIAAYVGGIPDMVTHGETGLLYRFEEFEMFAYAIRNVFQDDGLALKLSAGGILAASERHDRETNKNQMIKIYESYNN